MKNNLSATFPSSNKIVLEGIDSLSVPDKDSKYLFKRLISIMMQNYGKWTYFLTVSRFLYSPLPICNNYTPIRNSYKVFLAGLT